MDAQDPGHAGEYKITFDTSHTGPGESKIVGLGRICTSWKTKRLNTAKQRQANIHWFKKYLLIACFMCL